MRAGLRNLAIITLPNRLHLFPAIAVAALILIAAVLVPAHPASAQSNPASCAAGGAVADPANNPGLVSDCDALLAARDTLAGTATLNWSASRPIRRWYGVTVADSPLRITRLEFWGKRLTGMVPSELGGLSNLRSLYLYGHQLTGPIPMELGGLAKLESLYLHDNQLTGPIPSELGGLTNLRSLYLSRNQLTGPIPVELGGLSNLEQLSLDQNQLTGGIPAGLGGLANLESLYLHENQLTGSIPAELGDLSNLRTLRLDHNQLAGEIPTELGGLANLESLYLYDNQLTGPIPSELGNLSNLRSLYLSANQFTGCTPEGLRDVERHDLDEFDQPFCDVLLSGLALSPGSLVPQFDAHRTDYSASVGLSPVTVTVNPTNDHDATFLFLDENDGEVADADRTLAGFQVEFGAGVPAIKIRVVSQDNQATHTYTITDLGNRYDANDDRVIQRDEVITAIKDYFNDVITREETIEIIKLYFSS